MFVLFYLPTNYKHKRNLKNLSKTKKNKKLQKLQQETTKKQHVYQSIVF